MHTSKVTHVLCQRLCLLSWQAVALDLYFPNLPPPVWCLLEFLGRLLQLFVQLACDDEVPGSHDEFPALQDDRGSSASQDCRGYSSSAELSKPPAPQSRLEVNWAAYS